jgi:hypothetical protein
VIDLSRPRDVGEIINACAGLYRTYFSVFAGISLAVVIPLDLITLGGFDGYFTHGLSHHATATFGGGTGVAYAIVNALVTGPLVTAGQVLAVMDAGAGQKPSAGRSLEAAGPIFLRVTATVILIAICIGVGLLLLIIPGIYLYARFFVSPQAVVAEGLSPTEAMRRSGSLVEGMWWRVFGISLLLALLSALASGLFAIPGIVLAEATNSGPLYIAGQILADTVAVSFTALSGTLLYFDLRARKEASAAIPAGTTPS